MNESPDDVVTSMDDLDASDIENLIADIVAAINRPKQGSLDPDDGGYIPPLDLPGFGEMGETCGDTIPHFCPDCGHQVHLGRCCRRSVCPRCAARWVIDPAVQMTAKAESTAAYMSKKLGGVSVKKHHVIFSPPEDWFLAADDPLDRTFEVVSEILDALGAEGAVMYHGWTGNEDQPEDDRGKWKEWLFNQLDWEDVRAELMPRPHFHGVLVAPYIPGQDITERIYSETGWIIHRVADEDTGKSLPTTERVAETSAYTLSHTSIDTRGEGNNKAQYRKYGATWHDASVYDYRRRAAEHAVRSVAPMVLGIPAKQIRCEASVEDASDGVELVDDYSSSDDSDSEPEPDSAAGDADGDGDGDHDLDDHDESDLETCKGALVPISRADEYLSDEEWVERVPFADTLRKEYQDFQDKAQLDNPPPLVAAFA